MIQIQMQLPLEEKTFSEFFTVFSNSRLNLNSFEKKDNHHSFVFPKLRTRKT